MTLAEDIRNGLVANLQPLSIENDGPIGQIAPYVLSNPTPPAIFISDGDIDYDIAMHRGADDLTFIVIVLLPYTSDMASQMIMDELRDPAGTTSVKAAIESDRTLGGAVDDLHVVSATRPKVYERTSGPPYLGAEWTVTVIASGA